MRDNQKLDPLMTLLREDYMPSWMLENERHPKPASSLPLLIETKSMMMVMMRRKVEVVHFLRRNQLL